MRLLITGASGNLGRPLSSLAASRWSTTSTYFTNPAVGGGHAVQLDLRQNEAVLTLVHNVKPDVIIHAAASDRSADMVETNAASVRNISQAARSAKCRLLALSTDMVYDGTKPPYSEDDLPTPTHPYGKVKAENEQYLLSAGGDCLIVRTSLIYDLAPENRQIAWMQRLIASGQQVPLFTDEVRQPIWAWNLAEILLELAESDITGILNIAGPQPMNRWEYGCALLQALGHDPVHVAQPVQAAELAPLRPRNCTLRLDRAHAVLHTPLIAIEQALERAAKGQFPGQPTSMTTKR